MQWQNLERPFIQNVPESFHKNFDILNSRTERQNMTIILVILFRQISLKYKLFQEISDFLPRVLYVKQRLILYLNLVLPSWNFYWFGIIIFSKFLSIHRSRRNNDFEIFPLGQNMFYFA